MNVLFLEVKICPLFLQALSVLPDKNITSILLIEGRGLALGTTVARARVSPTTPTASAVRFRFVRSSRTVRMAQTFVALVVAVDVIVQS